MSQRYISVTIVMVLLRLFIRVVKSVRQISALINTYHNVRRLEEVGRFKDCSKCHRVFTKPHKYITMCPKCRQDLKDRNQKGRVFGYEESRKGY